MEQYIDQTTQNAETVNGEAQAQEAPALVTLADNQVKLSDGRIVELRELTGADEMIVSAELGKAFTPDAGGSVILQTCLLVKSIAAIDGQPVEKVKGFEGVRDFLKQFKSKDYNRIRMLYVSMNGEEEGK
jgi:hypothetical protein